MKEAIVMMNPRALRRPDAAGRARPTALLLTVASLFAVLALLVVAGGPASARSTATVKVYFSPSGADCDAVRAHDRRVPTPRVLTGALTQLLAGPTGAEEARTATMFSTDTAGMLRSVMIRDGVAHVDFADLRTVIPGASTSCGSAALLAQLDATVTQFPTVDRARYAIEGSEATFYAWLQRGTPDGSTATATRGSLANTAPIAHDSDEAATLRRVRVGRHDGFDRLVFEFDGGVPRYHVQYAAVARTGGGGVPIAVVGTTALQIDLAAGTIDHSDPSFPQTFTPSGRLTPGYPTLRQVAYGNEFEGQSVFAAGLTGRTGFRVLELRGPARLAIDVAHGAQVRTLTEGHRGPDVRDWQHRLNEVQFGHFASSTAPGQGPLAADGMFGPRTEGATRTFQRAEDVRVSGVVDQATRAAMEASLRRASQAPA